MQIGTYDVGLNSVLRYEYLAVYFVVELFNCKKADIKFILCQVRRFAFGAVCAW